MSEMGRGDLHIESLGFGESGGYEETAEVNTVRLDSASEGALSSEADDPGPEGIVRSSGPESDRAGLRGSVVIDEPPRRPLLEDRGYRPGPGYGLGERGERPVRSEEESRRNGEPGGEAGGGGHRPAEEAQRIGEAAAEAPATAGEEIKSTAEPGREAGGGGYRPTGEAQQAGEVVTELLGETRDGLNTLIREHESAIIQTAGLAQAIDRLTVAVDALTRTVAALMEELKAGRSGGSLAAVAVIQKPVADSAAEEAVSAAASAGLAQRALRAIVAKLGQVGEWLWSMIIHLVTIREWSLGGKIKVPGIAEASIT
jgi:hypothetical protein